MKRCSSSSRMSCRSCRASSATSWLADLAIQPAAQRSFEQVSGEIADLLRRREAAALAEKDGAAKLEQLRKGGDAGVKWSAPRTVSRRDAQGLPAEVLRRIVAADVSKLPA